MWLGCDSWRVPPTQFSSAFMRLLVLVYYVNELAQKKCVYKYSTLVESTCAKMYMYSIKVVPPYYPPRETLSSDDTIPRRERM